VTKSDFVSCLRRWTTSLFGPLFRLRQVLWFGSPRYPCSMLGCFQPDAKSYWSDIVSTSVPSSGSRIYFFEHISRSGAGWRSHFLYDSCYWLLQVRAHLLLEPPDQRAWVFLVQIELTPLSLVLARKLFSEMSVRTWATFLFDFCHRSRTCCYQHRFVFPLWFLT
jgi:hypothetical protein